MPLLVSELSIYLGDSQYEIMYKNSIINEQLMHAVLKQHGTPHCWGAGYLAELLFTIRITSMADRRNLQQLH